MSLRLSPANTLPTDGLAGTLVGRAWVPGPLAGPSPVVLREDGVFDISQRFATLSALFEEDAPLQVLRDTPGRYLGSVEELLANSGEQAAADRLHLLPPADLQVIKAAGVTFAASMLERVIEEQAGGDAGRAVAIREQVQAVIGADLQGLEPGSPRAQALKALLIEKGMWSQYLEVGIGPDAEIFTKAQPLSAVGCGQEAGLHPGSQWNNPEPEIALVVASDQRIVGASLGNDVNLRDFEGRSALLLGKAKDNAASCALGPFVRLFDDRFSLDDVRRTVVSLEVMGADGFRLSGTSPLSEISRDPADLVEAMMGGTHQYPDGAVLFLGTMFAPVEDRGAPGQGFTHQVGDRVVIRSPGLGALVNRMRHCQDCEPWTFGAAALMRNLAGRGLLGA